ncbi:hypothetical protein MBLNU230_g7564t1 [Neophaeotheca triangularis]
MAASTVKVSTASPESSTSHAVQQKERTGQWRSGLFSGFCGANSFKACLGSWFCTNCFYGKMDDRLHVWPDLDSPIVDPIGLNEGCLMHYLTSCCHSPLTMAKRIELRQKFGIQSDDLSDCLYCIPCALAQMNTELKVRAHEAKEKGGYSSHQETMVYVAQPPGSTTANDNEKAATTVTASTKTSQETAKPTNASESAPAAQPRATPAVTLTPASSASSSNPPTATKATGEPVTVVSLPDSSDRAAAANTSTVSTKGDEPAATVPRAISSGNVYAAEKVSKPATTTEKPATTLMQPAERDRTTTAKPLTATTKTGETVTVLPHAAAPQLNADRTEPPPPGYSDSSRPLTATTKTGELVTVVPHTAASQAIPGPIGPPPPGSVERPVVAVSDD